MIVWLALEDRQRERERGRERERDVKIHRRLDEKTNHK
jgi:hypothetical protein